MPLIKLPQNVIRKLSAGPTIPSLATAVKELIENALDAGATSIDILLQNHGLSQIQVIDNGTGIPAADREFICKRHYTSKTDGDLTNGISTFGFRGEALSSICELSEYVEILTKCKDEDVGLKMKFDSKGNMINKFPEQCRVGTTVTVVNIFSKFPVRRQTATGSINRLYKEIVSLVDEYSIICFDVRFCLKNGSKTEIMKHSLKSLRDSICARRGKKVLNSLREETSTDSTKNISIHAFVPNDPESMFKKVEKFIMVVEIEKIKDAKPIICVNKRPVIYDKGKKLINKQLRAYLTCSDVFSLFCITVPKETVDVNVSPDKRTVFFSIEADILEVLGKLLQKVLQKPTPPVVISNATPGRKGTKIYAPEPKTSPEVQNPFKTPPRKKRDAETSKEKTPIPAPLEDGFISAASPEPGKATVTFDRHYVNHSTTSPKEKISQRSAVPETEVNNLLASGDPNIVNMLPESMVSLLNDPKERVPSKATPHKQSPNTVYRTLVYQKGKSSTSPHKRPAKIIDTDDDFEDESPKKKRKFEKDQGQLSLEEFQKTKKINETNTEDEDAIVKITDDEIVNAMKLVKNAEQIRENFRMYSQTQDQERQRTVITKQDLQNGRVEIIDKISFKSKEMVIVQLVQQGEPKNKFSLHLFDIQKCDEILIYSSLKQTHKFDQNMQLLEKPIDLSNHAQLTVNHLVLLSSQDYRDIFRWNGFEISCREDNSIMHNDEQDPIIELVGILHKSVIPDYGVEDLVELMDKILNFEQSQTSSQPDPAKIKETLGYLRPTKLLRYLNATAARMAQNKSNKGSWSILACEKQLKKIASSEYIQDEDVKQLFSCFYCFSSKTRNLLK